MQQIKILLSSVLTLLLITSNNASAYIKFDGIQAQQPNMNSSGRFMPKRNRLGDDISGYGYKNILKKGNVFKGNVRVLPNRGSYTDSGRVTYIRSGKDGFLNEATLYQNGKDGFIVQTGGGLGGKEGEAFNPTSKYSISDEPAFVPKPAKMHDSIHCVNPSNCLDKSSPKFGGQEGEAFNPTSKYSISDEPAFVPKPDGALGPDVVTTLEHGPGIVSTGGVSALEQPKGIPLEFINGVWTEPQPVYVGD